METKLAPEYWKTKKLENLNEQEWEALCDHCGKCCVKKFRSKDGSTLFSKIPCEHLDLSDCSCKIYDRRLSTGRCVRVDWKMLQTMSYLLPASCAYKRLLLEQELPEWHPLVTGQADSAVTAKQTMASIKLPEENWIKMIFGKIETMEVTQDPCAK